MTNTDGLEDRFVRLARICLALPETAEVRTGRHAHFHVRGKKFAYYLLDHHGDGIVSVCCRAEPGENAALAALDPDRFYIPAYIGPRGWVALRLDLPAVDWAQVAELVAASYRLAAPRRLAAIAVLPALE
jgi:hypothetical protein